MTPKMGASSLALLRSLPIDKVKIDRSFVTNVLSDKENATIVNAIVGEMDDALKQARQLRAGGHQNVMMHDPETNVSTPIDEFDGLDRGCGTKAMQSEMLGV